jgi:hypothetical protein
MKKDLKLKTITEEILREEKRKKMAKIIENGQRCVEKLRILIDEYKKEKLSNDEANNS